MYHIIIYRMHSIQWENLRTTWCIPLHVIKLHHLYVLHRLQSEDIIVNQTRPLIQLVVIQWINFLWIWIMIFGTIYGYWNVTIRCYHSSSVFEERSPEPKRYSKQECEAFDKLQFTPVRGPPPEDDLPFLSASTKFHIGKESNAKRKHTRNTM